jgi:hypothetical protein
LNYADLRSALTIEKGKIAIASSLSSKTSDLIGGCYGGLPIQIDNAAPGPGDDLNETVVIAGRSSFLNVSALPVVATFFVDDQGDVSSVLRYTLSNGPSGAGGWGFPTSFPDIPKVFGYQPPFTGEPSSPLDQLDLSNASFIVTTDSHKDDLSQVSLEVGINFVGDMTPSGIVGILESTLGDSGALTLYGTINLPQAAESVTPLQAFQFPWDVGTSVPGIDLRVDLGVNIDLAGIKFRDTVLRIFSPLSTDWLDQNLTFDPVIAYTGSVDIPSADISIDLAALVQPGVNEVLFRGDFSGLRISKITDMLDMAPGADMASFIPEQISGAVDSLGKLELVSAAVHLSLGDGGLAIDRTYFSIKMPELNWNVWDDQFQIDNIACSFAIYDPFGSPSVSVQLVGATRLVGVPINIRANSVENFSVTAELAEAQAVSLKQFMSTYLPGVAAPGDLTIDSLAVTVSPRSHCSANATMAQEDVWNIPFGSTSELSVRDLSMTFSARKENGQTSATGEISGSASLNGIQFDLSAKMDDEVVLSGSIPRIKLANLAGEILPDDSIPESLADLDFVGVAISVTPETGDFSISGRSASPWVINSGVRPISLSEIKLDIKRATVGGSKKITGMISGKANVAGSDVELTATLDKNLTLTGSASEIYLRALASSALKGLTLPPEFPEIKIVNANFGITPSTGELNIQGSSPSPWRLPVGSTGLTVSNVSLDASRKSTGEVSVMVSGELTVGDSVITLTCSMPGEYRLTATTPSISLRSILESVLAQQTVDSLAIPPVVLDSRITNAAIDILPSTPELSISGETTYGKAELRIAKPGSKPWAFSFAIGAETFNFSDLDGALSSLNGLALSDTVIIVSSSDDAVMIPRTITLPDPDLRVTRGLAIHSSMDMRNTGIDELTGVEKLVIGATIGTSFSDFVLKAKLDGEVMIAEDTTFGDITLEIVPVPGNASLTLFGTISTVLDDSPLIFIGGFRVTPRSASMQATMLGDWHNPFDAQGLTVSNVALDLGITFVPLVPSLGIAGTMTIGSTTGSVAVRVDTAFPAKSMLAVSIENLRIMDFITAFCEPELATSIRQNAPPALAEAVVERAEVYVAPQDTQIGQLHFEQGFGVMGALGFDGWTIRAKVLVSAATGFHLSGDMDPIDLGDALRIRGSGQPNPAFAIDARPGEPLEVFVSGSAAMLGISGEIKMVIAKTEFLFFMSGAIFDVFEASIEIKGENLKDSGSIQVKATMQADLFGFIQDEIIAAATASADAATAEIAEAQESIRLAQTEVDLILKQIETERGVVRRRRAAATTVLNNAQTAVNNAQASVNSINTTIRYKESEKAREAAKRVTYYWSSWVPTPTYWQPFKGYWRQHSGSYPDPRGVARAAQLQIELAGLYTSRGVKNTALAVANTALGIAKNAIDSTPIDAAPAIVILQTKYNIATTALTFARDALTTTSTAVSGAADLAESIAKNGMGQLVRVNSATFEASLSAASGGRVKLDLDVVFNGAPYTYALDFDFNDPVKMANELVKELLPG